MKKCYLDTNILVAYKIEESPHHAASIKLIEKLIQEEMYLFISSLGIDEFLHTTKYYLGFAYKDVYLRLKQVLLDVLSLPNLSLVNPSTELKLQLEVITLMEKYKLRPRDAYHLLIMQSNQIDTFATFDTDFDRVYAKKIIKQFKV